MDTARNPSSDGMRPAGSGLGSSSNAGMRSAIAVKRDSARARSARGQGRAVSLAQFVPVRDEPFIGGDDPLAQRDAMFPPQRVQTAHVQEPPPRGVPPLGRVSRVPAQL